MCFSVYKHMMGDLCSLNNYLKYVKLLLWLSMWSVFINVSYMLWKKLCVNCWGWSFIFSTLLLCCSYFQYYSFIWLTYQLLQWKCPSLILSFSPYNSSNFYFLYFGYVVRYNRFTLLYFLICCLFHHNSVIFFIHFCLKCFLP